MAIPAGISSHFLHLFIAHSSGIYKLLIKLCVTTDAIVHDDLRTGFYGLQGCLLASQCKNSGVTKPILGFKKILIHDIVVRNMAVVTGGVPGV